MAKFSIVSGLSDREDRMIDLEKFTANECLLGRLDERIQLWVFSKISCHEY